jgi:tRNA_anti-like
MNKKIFLIITVLIVIAGLVYAFREYNRTNKDLKNVNPDYTTTMNALVADFEKDSSTFNKKYIDKVIEVKGTVKSIDMDGSPVIISLGESGSMSSVECSMDSSYSNFRTVKEGNQVAIKGNCFGGTSDELFGTDVSLNRCILIETK